MRTIEALTSFITVTRIVKVATSTSFCFRAFTEHCRLRFWTMSCGSNLRISRTPEISEKTTVSIGLCIVEPDSPLTDRELLTCTNWAGKHFFAKENGKNRIATYRRKPPRQRPRHGNPLDNKECEFLFVPFLFGNHDLARCPKAENDMPTKERNSPHSGGKTALHEIEEGNLRLHFPAAAKCGGYAKPAGTDQTARK